MILLNNDILKSILRYAYTSSELAFVVTKWVSDIYYTQQTCLKFVAETVNS